jgi:uncharacterized membrane protein
MTVLHVASEAPAVVRFLADAALATHIGGGTTALISGTVAVFARKGEAVHRAAGNVFFASMLAMAGVGAIVGPFLPDRITGLAGVFTLYLVATAWATVMRPEGKIGRFETIAFVYALAALALALLVGLQAEMNPKRQIDGFPAEGAYIISGLIALSAALDLRVILRGGITGAGRIARHLWRMMVALFIAMGSYFLGQPKFVPAILKETSLNFVPVIMVVVLLVYWLIRVLFTRWASAQPQQGASMTVVYGAKK